ncbi:unnamed protein product [Pylaiella littoralis]
MTPPPRPPPSASLPSSFSQPSTLPLKPAYSLAAATAGATATGAATAATATTATTTAPAREAAAAAAAATTTVTAREAAASAASAAAAMSTRRDTSGPEAEPRPRALSQVEAEDTRGTRGGKDEAGATLLDNVNVRTGLWERQQATEALRIPASDVGADADARAGAGAAEEGHFQAVMKKCLPEERGGLISLRGQCSGGDDFTVSSGVVPSADGCYSAADGTDFGEGFFYTTDDADNKRSIYPKVITIGGESSYFWAASALVGFSNSDSIVIDCISVEPTSTHVHPAAASWSCDVDATGRLVNVTDEQFFLVCGCGTTATSGSSSSSSSNNSSNNIAPSAGGAESSTTAPTATPGKVTATPASINPDTESEASGGSGLKAGPRGCSFLTASSGSAAAAVTLAAGVLCAALVPDVVASLLFLL